MTTPTPLNEIPAEAVTCPVCGAVLQAFQAAQTYTLRDQQMYFDRTDCFQNFLHDPEKYFINGNEEDDE